MRLSFLLLATGLACGFSGAAEQATAQLPTSLSIQAHMGASVPRGGLAERWGVGIEYGASAAVSLLSDCSVYAGYSRTFFDLDPIDDMHAVSSGVSIGLLRAFPTAQERATPWIGAGLLAHDLRITGTRSTGGDGRIGFEIGGGLSFASPIRPSVRLNGTLGYRRYNARILDTEREPVAYLSLAAGLSYSF